MLAFKSPYKDEVPPHVTSAISKMYRELKANGSLINDVIHTKTPIIPNVFHFVRFVAITLSLFVHSKLSGCINIIVGKNRFLYIIYNNLLLPITIIMVHACRK